MEATAITLEWNKCIATYVIPTNQRVVTSQTKEEVYKQVNMLYRFNLTIALERRMKRIKLKTYETSFPFGSQYLSSEFANS